MTAVPADAAEALAIQARDHVTSNIHVTAADGYLSLACFTDDPDSDTGQHIRYIDPGDTWNNLAHDVALHVASHEADQAAEAAGREQAARDAKAPVTLTALGLMEARVSLADRANDYRALAADALVPARAEALLEAAARYEATAEGLAGVRPGDSILVTADGE